MPKEKEYRKCPKCGIMALLVPKYDEDQAHIRGLLCRKCKREYVKKRDIPKEKKKPLTEEERIVRLESEIKRESMVRP